ncbi:MAG: YfcE family phosphodiesterase, partial [Candidatus Nanohaloarchaea archaeon]
MKTVAVLSDSHIPARAAAIPEKFLEQVENADITVHCGDFETREVYNQLEQLTQEFYAVKGNCERFNPPNSKKFEEKNHSIGAYHGTGITPRGDHETLLNIAENRLNVEILLHGHTHKQETVKKQGKLLLNPGSCTGVGGGSSQPGNPTMTVLKLSKNSATVEELELSD